MKLKNPIKTNIYSYAVFSLAAIPAASSAAPAPHAGLPTWQITEQALVQKIHENAPSIRSVEAAYSAAHFQERAYKQKYQLGWVTKYNHTDSNEKGIAVFAPTFGPTYQLSTSLQKKFYTGMTASVGLFTNEQNTTNGSITDATRTGVQFGFSMDLWKNLLGRLDRAETAGMIIAKERARVEADINKRVVELNLRKLYWSMVANDAKLKIARDLLATSEKQLRDGKRRQGQFTADAQEIARYNAQVQSRRSTISSLEFQRGLLVQQLKTALPDIGDKHIVVGPYNTEAKIKETLVCAVRLGSTREIPWDNTRLDQVVGLIEASYKYKKQTSDRYNDIDLQLTSNFRVTGIDSGLSNSIDDFTGSGQTAYDVGVQLTVPIGSTGRRAREAKISADYLQFEAEKQKVIAQIIANHTQIAVLVKMLNDSVQSIKSNNQFLEKSIKESARKFRQARIPLNNLIADQDAYFNSLLQEIDTKLAVIHTLFDYFQTFTDDPCTLNKIGA